MQFTGDARTIGQRFAAPLAISQAFGKIYVAFITVHVWTGGGNRQQKSAVAEERRRTAAFLLRSSASALCCAAPTAL